MTDDQVLAKVRAAARDVTGSDYHGSTSEEVCARVALVIVGEVAAPNCASNDCTCDEASRYYRLLSALRTAVGE